MRHFSPERLGKGVYPLSKSRGAQVIGKTVQNAVQNDHLFTPFYAILLCNLRLPAPLEPNISSQELLLRFFASCCGLSSLFPVVAAAAHKKHQRSGSSNKQVVVLKWGFEADGGTLLAVCGTGGSGLRENCHRC
jgi:hypothetical protein